MTRSVDGTESISSSYKCQRLCTAAPKRAVICAVEACLAVCFAISHNFFAIQHIFAADATGCNARGRAGQVAFGHGDAHWLAGKNVALITDAGTPAISDPGEVLVKKCHESGIKVTSLPGASACITALTLSGLSTRRFCFEGFLPSDRKERDQILAELQNELRTIVIYEAPHHLRKTLKELSDTLGNRKITLCRELTKKYETVTPTDLGSALEIYENEEPRGEYVLVIEGKDRKEIEARERKSWESMTLQQHMEYYEKDGLEKKEAMKKVASDRGISKRDVYNELLKNDSV